MDLSAFAILDRLGLERWRNSTCTMSSDMRGIAAKAQGAQLREQVGDAGWRGVHDVPDFFFLGLQHGLSPPPFQVCDLSPWVQSSLIRHGCTGRWWEALGKGRMPDQNTEFCN